jgi:hypothetical protein
MASLGPPTGDVHVEKTSLFPPVYGRGGPMPQVDGRYRGWANVVSWS